MAIIKFGSCQKTIKFYNKKYRLLDYFRQLPSDLGLDAQGYRTKMMPISGEKIMPIVKTIN